MTDKYLTYSINHVELCSLGPIRINGWAWRVYEVFPKANTYGTTSGNAIKLVDKGVGWCQQVAYRAAKNRLEDEYQRRSHE